MKRESKKNFSPAALAGFFQAQAGLAITEDLDVWPRLLSQLQPERVAAGILTWGYERWMEETMEPNQVWVWITCYVDHEQEAADALRKAFAAAGIPEQLLDIVVPTSSQQSHQEGRCCGRRNDRIRTGPQSALQR